MYSDRVLVIRRDNIGDLVCTTPLLRALRRQMPNARIDCLVTHYNQAVLQGHPDIDNLYTYTKAKHRAKGESVLKIYWKRLVVVAKMRMQHYSLVLLPGGASPSALRFSKLIKGEKVFIRGDQDRTAGPHEVEQCCNLLQRVGLTYDTPPPLITVDSDIKKSIQRLLPAYPSSTKIVGLHISARKPSQRWPAESFAVLARRLAQKNHALVLLWAPGASDNPQHPGDDFKAEEVIRLTTGLPITPVPTQKLNELIGALSLCDYLVCGDGGAMHLAAGLGKPIVCLFGQSTAAQWHPWGVPYRLLQNDSLSVEDISTDQVMSAFMEIST